MDCVTFKIGFSSVLIVLVLFGLVTSYECPRECDCYQKGYNVSAICRFANFNFNTRSFNFSVLAPENTTALVIICEKLSPSTLQPRMFQELYRLEEIIISDCYLDQIEEDVFAGLYSLKNLSIFNAVKLSIHPKTFRHVPNLVMLKIVNSGWHGLSPNSLCMLSKIHTLDFSENQISNMSEVLNLCSLKQYFFSELTSLKLNFNQIQFLKSDFRQRLTNLQILSLQGNKIEKIENGALTNFSQLRYLDVSHNNLTHLPGDFLSGCFQVQTVIVSNNSITKLSPAIGELENLWILYADNTLLTDITLLEQTSLIILKIHNSSLTTIPPRLCRNNSDLIQLELGENSISKVPLNIFKHCTKLQLLDLSANNISILFNESFKGLESLNMLRLSNNNISSCGKETFLNTPNLIKLNLSSNSLPEIPLIPEKLKTMDLNNNQIRSISKKLFSHYRSFYLRNLFLVNNRIQQIEDGAFQSLHELSLLNLKKNNLTRLNRFAFKDLINLIGLNIAYNKITDIHLTLYELKALTKLFAQYNLISQLQPNTFPEYVSTIDLANNQIKTVAWWTFANLINLRMVDLRFNRIVTLSLFSVRVGSTNIISDFYISGNPFQCDCKLAWLKEKSEIKLPRIRSTYPEFRDLGIVTCFKYGKRWLQDGMFQKIEANKLLCQYKRSSHLKLSFSCGIFCDCCHQENCYCQDTCPENCLCTHTYNRNANFANCNNGNLTDGTGIPSNATWIDLSANNLGDLSNKTFIRQSKVETLYLNHSKITQLGKKTFITFNLLKVLHLEYNEIRMLDSGSLLGLRNLKELFLSHNEIERILPGTFNVTPSLEVLDLSYNNLRQIDSQTLNVNSLKTIVLSENPWSCDCEDMNSLRELLVSQSSEIDSQTLLCNQSQIPVLQYDIDFCRNKSLNSTIQMFPVQDTRLVYGLSIGLTLTVAVFIAGAILYMYRKEIQILLFVRFGWRILSKKNELDEEEKKYDAFVSFHNSQDEFVVNEMLPRLEGTTPAYKLCVHFRDFAVGEAIVDNITEGIENSKRTILLLNDQFLTSEWCRYEFQAAHLDALSNKLNSLILVLLEDVNPDLVDGGLKLYMKTKTYLRYDDPRFWDKLRFALPEKKEENTVNEENLIQLTPI